LRRILLSLLIALSSTLYAAGDALHQISERVDQHYNHLASMKADFEENYEGAGIKRSAKGVLFLKKPGKMRWEYSVPQEKLFVTDGKTAYFTVHGEQQVRTAPVKDLDDMRSPLRYLLGKTRLEKEMGSLSFAAGQAPSTSGNWILRGIPESMGDRIADVLLEINPQYQISRIVIHGNDGSTTEFRFSNLREDLHVEDSLFSFKPAPGVEVVEDKNLAH
jgi:outer membrane lipoprotein carrier protein